MKKIGLLFAVLVMSIMFAVSADAREILNSGYCGAQGDNITWELYDDGDLVFSGEGDMRDYKRKPHETTAPTKPKDESSPWITKSVKRVLFDDKITHIGNYSFDRMETIEEVKFPLSLISIGTSAFDECINLSKLEFPEELTVIGSSAFCGIDGLIEIDLPDKLQEIGSMAFCRSMKNIKSIRIPESTTKIGSSAFYSYDSDALESIIIESRFELSDYTWIFSGCPSKCTIYLVYSKDEINNMVGSYYFSTVFGDANLVFDYRSNTKPISMCSISKISSQKYNGKKLTQNIEIFDTDSDYLLQENIDYKITYKNNDGVNVATLELVGIGKYSCSVSYEYDIIPELTISNVSDGIKIQWYAYKYNKKYTADDVEYTLYRKSGNDNYKRVYSWFGTPDDLASEDDEQFIYSKDLKTIYFVDKAPRVNGRKYTYKLEVIADTLNEKKIVLEPAIASIYKVDVPKNISITKGYKALTVSYDKNSKATGYEIYRSATKNGTYKIIKTTTSTSYKNTNLAVGDKYYYKVRAYYVLKDVKYYSAFSKVVGATVPSATLNYTKKTLYKGETFTVKLLYTKDTKGITWSSSDTSIATVSSKGKITAKNYGSCTIYAKRNGKTYSCKVTVKRIVPKNIVVVYNGYVTRDNYFIVRFDNEEKKPITIYSSGAYSQDFDYAYYDRNLKLYNGKSSITIKPGESQYVYFKVIGSQTWPVDESHTVYFKMYLDEKTYWVRTNKNGFEVKMNGIWTELD